MTDAIMNIRLRLLVTSCVALLPASAFSDISLQQNVKIEARGLMSIFDFEGSIVTEISGDMSRTENHDQTTSNLLVSLPGSTHDASIVRLDQDLMWTLHPDNRQFSKLTLEQKRYQMQRDIEAIERMPEGGPDALPISEDACQWTSPQVSIDRTGERERIAGVRAEQYLITARQTCNVPQTRQSCDMTWILDYWNARRMPGDDEVLEYQQALADRMGTVEMLASAQVVSRGLLAMFKGGWEEVIYEAEGLRGYPVKTVMSLHIGGKDCQTRSNDELTRDTVWTNVKQDSIQATKNQAAAQVGNVVAGETARQVGGSFGGVLVSSVMGILGRDATSRALEKKEEETKPVTVAAENVQDRIAGQVQIFRITSKLISVSGNRIDKDRFEIPAGWEGIESSGL